MAALQKFRAVKLGYPTELAEAIGVAEATKYAIFKNLNRAKKSQNLEEIDKIAPEYGSQKEALDWETFKLFKLAAKEGKPFVGGKVFTAEDYKKKVLSKWGEEGAKKIEDWARSVIEKTPPELLENEQKFFNKVWKEHRDEEIVVEF